MGAKGAIIDLVGSTILISSLYPRTSIARITTGKTGDPRLNGSFISLSHLNYRNEININTNRKLSLSGHKLCQLMDLLRHSAISEQK
jgi:hypothetical protein